VPVGLAAMWKNGKTAAPHFYFGTPGFGAGYRLCQAAAFMTLAQRFSADL